MGIDYLGNLLSSVADLVVFAVFAPLDSNPHFKNRPDSDLKVDMIIIISNGIVLFI